MRNHGTLETAACGEKVAPYGVNRKGPRLRRVRELGEIGKLLEQGRDEKGLTRQEVARRINISQPTYGQYEKGEVEGGCLAIARAAIELDLSVETLLIDTVSEDEARHLDELGIAGTDRLSLKECEKGLVELRKLCAGATESPIALFAEHINDLVKAIKEGRSLPLGSQAYDAAPASRRGSAQRKGKAVGDPAPPYGKRKGKR